MAFKPPTWFHYLSLDLQTKYMKLYETLPIIFPRFLWNDDSRNRILNDWIYERRNLPPHDFIPHQYQSWFWDSIWALDSFLSDEYHLWLKDPAGLQYAGRLFSYLQSWFNNLSVGGTLYISENILRSLDMPPIIWAFWTSPMEWFVKTSLLPFLTFLMGKLDAVYSLSNMQLYNRGQPMLILATHLVGGLSPDRFFRILPSTLSAMWKGASILTEETAPDHSASELTSGVERLLVALTDLVSQIRISIGQYRALSSSISTRYVGIFPLIHLIPGLDLSKYQIFDKKQALHPPPQASKHCLLWSLECANVPQPVITSMAAFIPGRLIRLCSLNHIFEQGSLHVQITYSTPSDPTRTKILAYGNTSLPPIQLGLVDNHLFLNEPIPVTPLYLKHAYSLPSGFIGQTNIAHLNHGIPDAFYDSPHFTSFDIINYLWKAPNLLRRMTFYETNASYRKLIDIEEFDDTHLSYLPALSTRPLQPKEADNDPPNIWFADFETFVSGPHHRPYLLCYGQLNNPVVALDCVPDPKAAIYQMLNTIQRGIIYFHNLSYDGSFLLAHLKPAKDTIIEYGSNKLLAFKILGPSLNIEFRDSLAVLPFPLRDFPKMLGINTEKEIMNYQAYNETTYRGLQPISNLVGPFSYEELSNAAARAGALEDDLIDMWKYAVYYCSRDVEVLAQGYFKMNTMMEQATNQSLWHRLTAPSLAFHSLRLQGVFEGCLELTGAPAYCIRKTAVGGRCMLRRNQKQHIQRPISDFDAVSLYPSAMSLLYTLKGPPKVITSEQLLNWNQEYPKWDGFFIEIEILSVGRILDFPLISYKEHGKRIFCNRTGTMWVNDITLEDLQTFHQITYRPLKGYYYNEGKNFRIQEVIKTIFNLRLDAKKQKQAIEVVYKLLMNSCYGKTIIKPRHTKKNIIDEEELLKTLGSSTFNTVSYEPLTNGNFILKSLVDALQNWSFPSLGSHVLAMSKRIITQVTSLAQELHIGIYYTDTDSIHIDKDRIEDLSNAFQERYHRNLIGKDLCQFHTDFPSTSRGMMWSEQFIGVGKKAYIDCLTDGVERSYHIRLKGIPEQSILKYCERHQITPDELYKRFFYHDDYKATFDICDAKTAFSRKSNYLISSLEHFTRQLSFPRSLEPFE